MVVIMISNWNIEGSKCGPIQINTVGTHKFATFFYISSMKFLCCTSLAFHTFLKQVGCLFLSDILLVMCPWRWASIKFSIEHKYW